MNSESFPGHSNLSKEQSVESSSQEAILERLREFEFSGDPFSDSMALLETLEREQYLLWIKTLPEGERVEHVKKFVEMLLSVNNELLQRKWSDPVDTWGPELREQYIDRPQEIMRITTAILDAWMPNEWGYSAGLEDTVKSIDELVDHSLLNYELFAKRVDELQAKRSQITGDSDEVWQARLDLYSRLMECDLRIIRERDNLSFEKEVTIAPVLAALQVHEGGGTVAALPTGLSSTELATTAIQKLPELRQSIESGSVAQASIFLENELSQVEAEIEAFLLRGSQ